MKKRTYKREDMIELNETNVAKIFTECLAENNPSEQAVIQKSFSTNPNVPRISFASEKIRENKEKIHYMYGQLYYRMTFDFQPGYLPLTGGCIKYDESLWTKNQNSLFAFYYLGVAALVIKKFLRDNNTEYISNNRTVPTLSPNDPHFEEWSKTVIEE